MEIKKSPRVNPPPPENFGIQNFIEGAEQFGPTPGAKIFRGVVGFYGDFFKNYMTRMHPGHPSSPLTPGYPESVKKVTRAPACTDKDRIACSSKRRCGVWVRGWFDS